MKKVVFFAAAALLSASSCVMQSEYDAVVSQRDSIQSIQKRDSMYLDQYLDIITEVQSNFKQIREVELGIIDGASQEGVNADTKAKIQEDFKTLTNNIQQQKEKISDLEEQLNKSQSQVSGLRGTINKLKKQLAESQQAVVELKQKLEEKDIKIAELESANARAAAVNDSIALVSAQQAEAIAAQDAALNEVYYIVATKDVLKQKGLLAKNLTKGSEVSHSGFTKVDKRDFNELEIPTKKLPVLISLHPLSSYTISLNGDKTKAVLKIKDYNKFWSNTSNLIIQIK